MLQEQFFTKINEEVLTLVLQRCEGNPLISLNFLFNLLAVRRCSFISLGRLFSPKGEHFRPDGQIHEVQVTLGLDHSTLCRDQLKDQ